MNIREHLLEGLVIPAHPLALTASRQIDEPRQRGLTRYYKDSGAGGIAVAVHTTQFAIRDAGFFEPVLRMAIEEWRPSGRLAIAGVCGGTGQALGEAELAVKLGYNAGLLSLAALKTASTDALLAHVEAVASIIPVVGFYLQPAVGGRILPYEFWRRMAAIENVVAIKVAPFHRYQTLDVMRAVAESGRAGEIAIYTGNDDNIIADLLATYDFNGVKIGMAGGLLGQWSVWTARAVEILAQCKESKQSGIVPAALLTLNTQLTDANAAIFDVANDFQGCIAGIHEVLRREGLLDGIWCLDAAESLGAGQLAEIDRVMKAYPHLRDSNQATAYRHK